MNINILFGWISLLLYTVLTVLSLVLTFVFDNDIYLVFFWANFAVVLLCVYKLVNWAFPSNS